MRCPGSALLLAAILLAPAAPAVSWQRNTTLHGVTFARVRIEADGLIVGRIDQDSDVCGRPCAHGWLHLHPNGMPAAFTAATDIVLPRGTIPAGTWVHQDPAGVVTICAFPRDLTIQGHRCRGTGGPKGVQTSFRPDGSLWQFYPVGPVEVDGVPCAPSLLRGWIELHPNGRLKSGLLSRDHFINGIKFRKGTRIELTPDRRPVR